MKNTFSTIVPIEKIYADEVAIPVLFAITINRAISSQRDYSLPGLVYDRYPSMDLDLYNGKAVLYWSTSNPTRLSSALGDDESVESWYNLGEIEV